MSANLIQFDFEDEASGLYCPVCGAALVVPEEDVHSCPHVLFAWIDMVGDFLDDCTKPEIRALAYPDDVDEVYSPLDDEFLAKCPNHTVVFALTESGFACGPVSCTIAVGIKFPD